MRDTYTKSLIVGLGTLIFLLGCSAAYKAVKRGDKFLEAGNYYNATQEYLTALRLKPEDQETRTKLCQIAESAYQQKLTMAQNFEQSADFESSLTHYIELNNFLKATQKQQCPSFTMIDVAAKIDAVRLAASEQFYHRAETLFAQKAYTDAIEYYKKALKHTAPYKDSNDKIAESFYRMATTLEAQKQFREAAQQYLKAHEQQTGYKDAVHKAVALYYSLGRYFLEKEWCRKAYQDLSAAIEISQNFRDLAKQLKQAENCAVATIAFVKFDNLSGQYISDISLEQALFDKVRTLLQSKVGRFVEVLSPSQLDRILQQHNLSRSSIAAHNVGRLKEINYLVLGELSQIHRVRPNPQATLKKTVGEQEYTCKQLDRVVKKEMKTLAGAPKVYQEEEIYKDATCTRSEPVMYTEYTDEITLSLSGSLKVFDTATQDVVSHYSIRAQESDSIAYADIMTDISKIEVSSYVTDLVNNRRRLKTEAELIEEMVAVMAEEAAETIRQDIDRAKAVDDPVDMKRYE